MGLFVVTIYVMNYVNRFLLKNGKVNSKENILDIVLGLAMCLTSIQSASVWLAGLLYRIRLTRSKSYILISSNLVVIIIFIFWIYLARLALISPVGNSPLNLKNVWYEVFPSVLKTITGLDVIGAWCLIIALILLVIISTIENIKLKDKTTPILNKFNPIVFLFYLLFFQVTAAILMSAKGGMWQSRYVIVSVPIFILLLGYIVQYGRLSTKVQTIFVIAILFSSLPNIFKIYSTKNEGYREAAQFIKSENSGVPFIVSTWHPNYLFYDHYLKIYLNESYILKSISNLEQTETLCEEIPKTSVSIYIFRHISHALLEEQFKFSCSHKFKIRATYEFSGIVVTTFTKI